MQQRLDLNGDAVFSSSPGAERPPGAICAHDGRSAAWMAAGWALTCGRPGLVMSATPWDHEQALAAAMHCTVPVSCLGPDGISASPGASPDPAGGAPTPTNGESAPANTVSGHAVRPLRVERVVSELAATAPEGTIVTVDDGVLAAMITRLASATNALRVLRASDARGSAIAAAVGAKAAVWDTAVVALVSAASFAVGGLDIITASRCRLPIAVIVVSSDRDAAGMPVPYERLAAVAGGHGEQVSDAAKLPLHLRNAFAASTPAVINAVIDPARAPAFAQSLSQKLV